MLLQTNSYFVPRDRLEAHARLMRRFREAMSRMGCDRFEVFEQELPEGAGGAPSLRIVQIMYFRDRRHQQQVHAVERQDAEAQQIVQEFCELVDLPAQQARGSFASSFYTSVLGAACEPGASHPQTPPMDRRIQSGPLGGQQ